MRVGKDAAHCWLADKLSVIVMITEEETLVLLQKFVDSLDPE
jgi:hypothetical protein